MRWKVSYVAKQQSCSIRVFWRIYFWLISCLKIKKANAAIGSNKQNILKAFIVLYKSGRNKPSERAEWHILQEDQAKLNLHFIKSAPSFHVCWQAHGYRLHDRLQRRPRRYLQSHLNWSFTSTFEFCKSWIIIIYSDK